MSYALNAVELRRIAMPLVAPFRTSFGSQAERDVLLVRVELRGADGTTAEGWGECVALAEPSYSPEYVEGAQHVIANHLLPRLFSAGPIEAADVAPRLAKLHGHPMAKGALEMAVLDAQLRQAGRSLAGWLGATRDRVPAGVSIGIPRGGVGALIAESLEHLAAGYLRIKVKIAPGSDVEPVTALRAELGADVDLQVDANAAYTPDGRGPWDALDRLDLSLIEQPFGARRLAAHARLAARLRTPVCLDESLADAADTADAIAAGACDVVNLKPGRVGGLVESLRVHDVCARTGTPLWIGGMLETGLGRAANVAVAALPAVTLPGDTSASDRYFATDLTEPFVLVDGHLAVPTGPGLGRTPDDAVLTDVTSRSVTLA